MGPLYQFRVAYLDGAGQPRLTVEAARTAADAACSALRRPALAGHSGLHVVLDPRAVLTPDGRLLALDACAGEGEA